MQKRIKINLFALLVMVLLLISLNILENTIGYYIILGPILMSAGLWIVTEWFSVGKRVKCAICGKRSKNDVICNEGNGKEISYCLDCYIKRYNAVRDCDIW